MRVLVCGSRHFKDYELLRDTLSEIKITTIIHGAAKGADTYAGFYGMLSGIPVEEYPADWKLHGKRAGPIRNGQMLLEGTPDLVVAFLAPDSRGTRHMIEIAEKAGVKTIVIPIGSSLQEGEV